MRSKHKRDWTQQILEAQRSLRKAKFASPEYKAGATRGEMLKGKISLSQFLILVEHGFDGDDVKRWTCYRAGKAITEIVEKSQREQNDRKAAEAERFERELARGLDEAVAADH